MDGTDLEWWETELMCAAGSKEPMAAVRRAIIRAKPRRASRELGVHIVLAQDMDMSLELVAYHQEPGRLMLVKGREPVAVLSLADLGPEGNDIVYGAASMLVGWINHGYGFTDSWDTVIADMDEELAMSWEKDMMDAWIEAYRAWDPEVIEKRVQNIISDHLVSAIDLEDDWGEHIYDTMFAKLCDDAEPFVRALTEEMSALLILWAEEEDDEDE